MHREPQQPLSGSLRLDWSGLANPDRRRVQNRINQRAKRERLRQQQKAPPISHHGETRDAAESKTGQFVIKPPHSLDPVKSLSPFLEDWRVRRVFHFARSIASPEFDQIILPSREPINMALFRSALNDPTMFNTFIGFLSDARWRMFHDKHDRQLHFESNVTLFKTLRAALDSGFVSDGLMTFFTSLDVDKTILPVPRPRGLFDSPILTVGSLHSIGCNDGYDYLIESLERILRQRGGILSIKMPGVAESLQMSLLVWDSHRLRKPSISLCRTSRLILAGMESSRPSIVEAEAFGSADVALKEIILDLRQCCQLMNIYCDHRDMGTPMPFEVGLLGQCRDVIQYRLLQFDNSLPSSTISRLGAMIFSYGVTYPFPDPNPIRTLSKHLMWALREPACLENQTPELVLWAATMAAMAVSGNTETAHEAEWFLYRIAELADQLNIRTWPAFKTLMESFIWHNRACDEGGRLIWSQITGVNSTAPPRLLRPDGREGVNKASTD
ncbi:hypothetical protein BX600DRAFT_469002 [Xylariales sp. PMI_506]|nr:hypothetical protein BX600DRAFT_469002 [Xylariales sp. PMI_506]